MCPSYAATHLAIENPIYFFDSIVALYDQKLIRKEYFKVDRGAVTVQLLRRTRNIVLRERVRASQQCLGFFLLLQHFYSSFPTG